MKNIWILFLINMSNYKVINCDLLEVEADYLAHQCNATGNRSLGLSSVIFKKWPSANVYSGKNKVMDRKIGTLIVRENIINMIAQIKPGKPNKTHDSKEERKKAFEKCLEEIGKLEYGEFSVAFPFGIGCGLAGGNWKEYEQILKDFAQLYPNVIIIVCKLD